MNPQYEQILQGKTVREVISNLDEKEKANLKAYAIFKVLKKKKYVRN
jgi:hypothetical protein